MKRARSKKILFTAAVILMLATVISVLALNIFAAEEVDAMIDIKEAFDEKYKIGESYPLANDGYIGTNVELTTYYDYKTFGAAKTGYHGTNIALYFVNTKIERVGMETDVNIISDLLSRGFAVVTVDYFHDSRAKSPAIDWSSQEVRKTVINGSCFTDKTVFPSGTYQDTHVLPAGYSVLPFEKFWSMDEHGADGSLEKIVEIWNNDFRGYKRNTIVNWTRTETDGSGNEITVQKATQTGLDGSAPQWYSDPEGKNPVDASSADAKYIRLNHTLAETITDCTAKDGSPIDLDLTMHITYPVKPESNVPVMILSGSSEYLTTGKTGDDVRPHPNGYLFRGYAGALFDHAYAPMAYNHYYGYFDGSSTNSVTGDHGLYSMHFTYNSARIDTAAVRFLRYLAYTEPEKYAFDVDNMGMIGNSKGGMFAFIGSAELREYTEVEEGMTLSDSIDKRINSFFTNRDIPGHYGETRYQNGITEDYTVGDYTIRGGKLQPWMTYTDSEGVEREILSYVSVIYPGNGGNVHQIREGHAAIFNILCINDPLGNGYGSSAQIVAAAKTNNVPSVSFVTGLAHSLANGPDAYYNVDTYDALFAFSNYYLKGAPVQVLYTDPLAGYADMDTTSPITLKFSGAVGESEIAKITLCDSYGNAIDGIWESSFGNTEWKFIHEALDGAEEYTLTVPKGLVGENGAATTEAFSATYRTRGESKSEPVIVKTGIGTYITVAKQDLSAASGAKLRFLAANDAANVLSVTEVANYNADAPDTSLLGAKIGTVNIYGAGYYEVDVSESLSSLADGESKTFLLRTEKSAGSMPISNQNFGTSLSNLGNGKWSVAELATAPDGKNTPAAKIYLTTNSNSTSSAYTNSEFYPNMTTVITNNKLFSKITANDLGRKYTVTLKVYDTVSRPISLRFNNATNGTTGILDFDYTYYNLYTKANEWTEITFDYTVLDPLYGTAGLYTKTLSVTLATDGSKESPIYIGELSVTETVTDVTVSDIHVALYDDGTDYKASVSDKPFSIGDADYATLGAALSAAKSTDVIKANANYAFAESFTGLEKLTSLTLDLSGYKLYLDGSTPLLNARATATSVAKTTVTVKNGAVYIGNSPVVSYSGSSSSGSGKIFDINFENVKFIATDLAMAKKLISDSTVSDISSLEVNFGFDGCEFRVEKYKLAKNPVTLLPSGSGALKLAYTLKGGKIALDSMIDVTLWESYKSVTVEGALDERTVVTLPSSIALRELNVVAGDKICTYVPGESDLGITTYVTEENKNSTSYGIISEEYADENQYPFVAFDKDGNCLGGFKYFLGSNGVGSVLEKARTFLQNNGYRDGKYDDPDAVVYIVARRDYTLGAGEVFNNLAQFQGTVIVDLANHTLNQGESSAAFFKAASKGWSAAAGEKVFPVTVKVFNGKLLMTKGSAISMDTWDSLGDGSVANKEIKLIFDRVTFGFDKNATSNYLVASYNKATGTSVAAKFKVELNDCVFDYASVAPTAATTLFSTNTSGKYIDVDYTVNGGKILGGDFTNITVANDEGSYTSSVTFGKGSDGEYTALEVSSGAAVKSGAYAMDDGSYKDFKYSSTSGGIDIYKLAKSDLITPYGTIPSDYEDVETYPFVIFDGNGKFLKAYKVWLGNNNGVFDYIAYTHHKYNAWDSVTGKYTYNGGVARTAVIYLRRNYEMSSSDVKFQNTGAIQGEVTIDLGGHTLSQGTSSARVIPLNSKGWSGAAGETIFPTTLNFKNGKLLTKSSSLMSFEVWDSVGGGAIANKDFTVNFTDVTFGLQSDSSLTNYMIYFSKYQTPGAAAPFHINYNGCTFDFETVQSSKAMTLFGNNPDGNFANATMTINGGVIKLGSATNITLVKTSGAYGSSIVFDKYGNSYTYLTFSGSNVTSEAFNTHEGYMKFVKVSDGNYTLASLANSYGFNIPQNYGYAEKYPFILFDQNGNFLKAYEKFLGINGGSGGMMGNVAYTYLKGNGWDEENQKWTGDITECIALLRRDYTLGTDEYFNNWGHLQGSFTLDLGGYSISQQAESEKNALFKLSTKGWSSAAGAKVFPSTVTVKNGSINMYSTTVVSMDCWDSLGDGSIAKKYYTFNLEGVKVGLSKGATLTNLLVTTNKASTTTGVAPFFINFNDCEFDLVTNSNGKTVKLFNNDASADKYVSCDMRINGGIIKVSSADKVTLYSLNTTGTSSVTFAKGSEGYLKITLPSGQSAPATELPTANGNYKFVKTADNGSFVTYELAEDTLTSFIPKVSLTLYSNFVYNIYVPVRDSVKLVKINGEGIALTEDMITEIDGARYYRITKTLAAKEAATDFTLNVNVELMDGRTASAKWTLGILKYLDTLLKDSTISSEERALAENILVYIKSAYAYFGMPDANEVGERVDSILGKEGSVTATVTGEAVNVTEGLDSAAVVLGAEVAFKFTPNDSADAERFVFTQNGKKLKSEIITDGEKTYILVTTYAYGITDTVSYTAKISDDVTYSGSFNLKAYYDYAVKEGMTDVCEMLRALWQYSESAESFRASVAG